MMPVQPVDHPLNLTMQTILTVGSWSIALIFLAMAMLKDKRDGRPFYTALVLAGLVGAYVEPLYDMAFMLWFYAPGMWTHFTAFDIPQPNWTHSGYAILYSGNAMLIVEAIRKGLTRNGLFKWWLIALACSVLFEGIAINGGAYTYWGPHELRIASYPLVIGVLEATQVVVYSMVAAFIYPRITANSQIPGLFLLFPCTFLGINFGLGGTTIIALHWPTVSPALVLAGSLFSIFACLYTVFILGKLLPATQTALNSRPAMA